MCVTHTQAHAIEKSLTTFMHMYTLGISILFVHGNNVNINVPNSMHIRNRGDLSQLRVHAIVID